MTTETLIEEGWLFQPLDPARMRLDTLIRASAPFDDAEALEQALARYAELLNRPATAFEYIGDLPFYQDYVSQFTPLSCLLPRLPGLSHFEDNPVSSGGTDDPTDIFPEILEDTVTAESSRKQTGDTLPTEEELAEWEAMLDDMVELIDVDTLEKELASDPTFHDILPNPEIWPADDAIWSLLFQLIAASLSTRWLIDAETVILDDGSERTLPQLRMVVTHDEEKETRRARLSELSMLQIAALPAIYLREQIELGCLEISGLRERWRQRISPEAEFEDELGMLRQLRRERQIHYQRISKWYQRLFPSLATV